LQVFCPLQEFVALLQSLKPLQPLTPAQCTWPEEAELLDSVAQPANMLAAAAAKAIPEILLNLFMAHNLLKLDWNECRI
jgi:hypothetical protein